MPARARAGRTFAQEHCRAPAPARRLPPKAVVPLFAAACAALFLAAPVLWTPPICLLWNASASAPVGLYRVHPAARLGRGDMAAGFAPGPFRDLAAARDYVPASVPLIKRVAAISGDAVCASGAALLVNRRVAAIRLKADSNGRRLAWWQGCRRLRAGEVLLLGDGPRSFDGRYFGPTGRSAVLGKAIFLWRR